LARKWKRDLYGNRVPVEYDEQGRPIERPANARPATTDEKIDLDWRDYVALAIASLQTILLPIVIFIAVIVGIFLVLALAR
jgi:hypothetical protein